MSTYTPELEPLLDLKALAKILGISPATLYTLRTREPESVPPAVKVGGALRWRPADVRLVCIGCAAPADSLCRLISGDLPGHGLRRPTQRMRATPCVRVWLTRPTPEEVDQRENIMGRDATNNMPADRDERASARDPRRRSGVQRSGAEAGPRSQP